MPTSRTQRFGPKAPQPDPSPAAAPGARVPRRPTGPMSHAEPAPPPPRPHPALADLPRFVAGGHKMEPVADYTKLERLQEEAEKLRKLIDEKETKKRKQLRDWDRLRRESAAAAYRTQLAEEALRNANGEAESAAAF